MYLYSVLQRGGGLRQINTCLQISLKVDFSEKTTFRVWCLYSYLVHARTICYSWWCGEGGGQAILPPITQENILIRFLLLGTNLLWYFQHVFIL